METVLLIHSFFKCSNIRNRNLIIFYWHQELELQLSQELILQVALKPPKWPRRGRLWVRAGT